MSNIDGVVVSGRHLDPVVDGLPSVPRPTSTGTAVVDVDEVYQDEVGRRATRIAIEGDQIDLAPAVREYVLIELPDGPLCRDDCAGICPVCGADRNESHCECDTSVRDERWAALDDLHLDE